MTTNKKKLRRAERRYSVGRAAQTLVLTGLLLAGGVGSALAATEINGAATWDASAATGDITYAGTTGQQAAVSTSKANTAGTLGTLTITGNDTAAALTAANDLTFNGAVSITGASGKLGSLTIDAGKTFTSGVKTTVGDYGTLAINGTHVGALEATGATSAAIELSGTQKGTVTLNGTAASLTATDDKAAVWGDVIVTKGTLSTASNSLTIRGTDGKGLGNVTLGANSVLTLSATKILTLGTLTVNKDTDVAGKLSFAALGGDKKLTLNTSGDITVQDVDKKPLNVTLNQAGTTGLVLGDGGSLTAAALSLKGFNATDKAVTTATGALTLTANKLFMDEATTFGADTASKATTVNIRTKTGETVADFINHDITIKGYASNVGTLNLGAADATGTGTTTKNITLLGTANSADAAMNVGYGTFTVGNINVGSATDVASGGSGTITVNNGGTLNATTVNLFGLSAQAAKLDLAATAGTSQKANITTLNVGGENTYGAVTIAGNSTTDLSILSVTGLNLGAHGKITLNAHGALNINGDYVIADDKIGGSDVVGSIQVSANSSLHVRGALTITPAGVAGTGVSAGVAATGTVVADVVKAGADGTEKLTWTGGSLTLLGDGAGNFLKASELAIDGNGVNLGNVDDRAAGRDTKGGTFANKVTVGAGAKLHVNSGEWTLSNTTDGLSVKEAKGVEVTGGILNVAKWDSETTAAGTATVQGGTLNLTGGAGSVKTGDRDITASAGGVVTAKADAVLTADGSALATDVGKFVVTDTGVLKITIAKTDMELDAYTALKGKILDTGSTGTLRLEGVTIKGVNDTTNIQKVDGVSVAGNVVAVDAANTVTSFGTEVKGLKGTGATDVALTVSGGLTIVGGDSADFALSANGDHNTNITVSGAKSQLNLGSDAEAHKYGTLKGDVKLGDANAGGTINVVNGTFTVTGDITGSAKGSTINVTGAKLNATNITTGGTVASTINVTGGELNANKLTTKGGDTVAVSSGSLNVGEIVAVTGDKINVGNSAAAGTLTTDKMTLAGATLFLDPTWIEGQEYQDAGTASRAAIAAFANGTVDGIVMVGQNSQLSLGTKNVEQLTAAIRQMGNVWGSSSITAALGIYSPQTLAGTGAIEVNGNRTSATTPIDAKDATFADKSLLVVSATGVGSGVALTGTNLTTNTDSKLTVNAGAKLHILGGKAGETINIVAGFKDTNSAIAVGGWEGTNLTTDTALLTAKAGTAFTAASGAYSVILNQNAATAIFPKLSASMGGLVDTIVSNYGVDTMSGNTGIRFVSRAVSDSYIGTSNPTQAAATIEGAAQLAVVGAAPAMTISAAQASTSAATTRTSFATPLMDSTKAVALHQGTDGSLSLDSGLSAGDSMKTGLGVWIMPLYQSNNVWGMKAENFKGGYSSDLGGVAIGADYTIDDSLRFGLAFNLGGGYAQSHGDFNSTDNSFNFWGINAYGGWSANNFGISGDVGYTSTYNKVEQDVPSSMQMGNIKSDVTSHAWTAGLRGEYKFATEALDIIPHVGVRYLGLTTDSYKAKSAGETVFKVDEDFQNIWTFPIGVTFTKEIVNASGWGFRPQLDLGITPAAGDVKAKSRVRIPGVDGTAEMKMQVMDYMSYDGGVGLEMKKDNVSFGVNYNIQASEHRTGHGVFGTFRYEF